MDERLIHSKSHALHNETKFRHAYVCEVIGYVRSSMIHISLNKKGRPGCNIESPRCSAKSPIAQDKFQPNPGLISCAGVTGRWGLLSNAMVYVVHHKPHPLQREEGSGHAAKGVAGVVCTEVKGRGSRTWFNFTN